MVGWIIEFNRVIGGVASKVVVRLGSITNSRRRVVLCATQEMRDKKSTHFCTLGLKMQQNINDEGARSPKNINH